MGGPSSRRSGRCTSRRTEMPSAVEASDDNNNVVVNSFLDSVGTVCINCVLQGASEKKTNPTLCLKLQRTLLTKDEAQQMYSYLVTLLLVGDFFLKRPVLCILCS